MCGKFIFSSLIYNNLGNHVKNDKNNNKQISDNGNIDLWIYLSIFLTIYHVITLIMIIMMKDFTLSVYLY